MTTPAEDAVPEPVPAAPSAPAQPAPSAAPYAAAPHAAAPYAAAPPQAYAAPNDKPHTWMNITAFVTGLLGMAIVPIVFGHLGLSASNKGKADLKGLGIAGLVLGYLELVFWIVIWALIVGGTIAANNS